MSVSAIDLFAGPGGWSEGMRSLGLTDFGIEFDAAACDTRYAAGHATWQADVSTIDPTPFRGICDGLIASPPCQDFSVAGKRAGITGERGELVLEVPRWVHAIRPRWIACEQVPPVLDIWKLFARWFEEWGYSTWYGILNAADYGVPQTRQRAFLLAHRDRAVQPPQPTHEQSPKGADLFGDSRRPWVSMAEALGWNAADQLGFPRKDDRGDSPDGYRSRDWRSANDPSFALTEKARSWVVRTGANTMKHSRTGSKAGEGGVVAYERPVSEPAPTLDAKVGSAWRLVERQAHGASRSADEPAMTITASADNGNFRWIANWPFSRPATSVCGDPRIFPPEYRGGRRAYELGLENDPSQRAGTDAIRLDITEALILQGFRADYPVQGTKTKQFEQVGNAVPPPLAAAVLREVIA